MQPALHTHTAAHLDNTLNPRSSVDAQPAKRNASMIFRIEQLLPNVSGPATTATATATTTLTTAAQALAGQASAKRSRAAARAGVYAAQYTAKDTRSACVPTAALLECTASPSDGTRAHCALNDGLLHMSATLMRQIKLSEDIYSFNALFELQSGQLRVRIVRDVARDDEIVAWFGEELVLLMGIPFLTPLNIQGNNRYTCHMCHLTFETPHPLKIHLALGCGRSAMDILWIRLHYALKAAHTATQLSPAHAANSSTSSTSPTHSPTPPARLASAAAAAGIPQPRLSAFRPIAGMQPLATASSAPPALSLSSQPGSSRATLSYLPLAAAPLISMPATNSMNAAAQIEAIVSNMGASKQGHLCIYCGKVYSRKYGLKIHIRTHTGFKPLKCKFCLRPFGDPSNLNKHVRLHLQTGASGSGDSIDEPEVAHQCLLCHKTLARRRDLLRHMETRHAGEQAAGASTSAQAKQS